jgi:predicted CXXCH cytochrome family protein
MRRFIFSAVILLVAVILAGAALLFSPVAARAAGPDQTEACLACHPRSYVGEVHGLGTTNPVFKAAWDDQGNPKDCLVCHVTGYDQVTGTWKSDTISCEACHNPIPADHPNQKMPVNKTNQLCATCHTDSRFGWADWKTSVHYQQNITCSNCHDPHNPQPPTDDTVSTYCESCHKDMTQRAEHSTHALAGVNCISCHLGPKKGVDQFHKVPDHSFKPVVETCNTCHAKQMHDPNPTQIVTPTVTPTATLAPTALPVGTPTPPAGSAASTPFSTMDFTFLGAGLLGLGAIGGLALSPVLDWINHLFSRRVTNNNN